MKKWCVLAKTRNNKPNRSLLVLPAATTSTGMDPVATDELVDVWVAVNGWLQDEKDVFVFQKVCGAACGDGL